MESFGYDCYYTSSCHHSLTPTHLHIITPSQDCGEATDSSSKSYVLHSDTEEEMLEWIKALKEEMKPMVNGNKHEMVPNGRDQTTPTKASKIKGKTKSESSVKIDSSAFNEVS